MKLAYVHASLRKVINYDKQVKGLVYYIFTVPSFCLCLYANVYLLKLLFTVFLLYVFSKSLR